MTSAKDRKTRPHLKRVTGKLYSLLNFSKWQQK